MEEKKVKNCENGKIKSRCKKCGGSAYCEHGKRKSRCVECGGGEICEHGKRKSKCIDCKGNEICEHKKQKSRCVECDGSQICIHKKQKSICKECHGSQICVHNKQKSICMECGGSGICEHKKQKAQCKSCGGSSLCKSSWCERKKNKKYDNYCLYCYVNLNPEKPISRNYKTKEKEVVDYIKGEYPDLTWIYDKKIEDGCSRRRPDLLLELGEQIIIVEIDENAHTNYDCSCENKRLMEISQDVGHKPIVFLRFNPDSYIDIEGNKVNSCWKVNRTTGLLFIDNKKEKEWKGRLKTLIEEIKYWTENKTEKTIEIVQLYYDQKNEL